MSFLKINKCDVFVGLWYLYRLQNIAYPQGPINQAIVFIILIWGIIIGGRFFVRYRSQLSIIRATGLLIAMFIVYGLLAIIGPTIYFHTGKAVTSHVYLLDSLKSLLPIFVFSFYAYKGELTSKRIKVYFLMLLPVIIANYYYNYSNMVMESLTGRTEFTSNVGYEFLSLFPMILFFDKRPLLQYSLALLLSYFIFMGMKRGAVLIAIFCLLFFIINTVRMSKRAMSRFFVFSILAVVAFIAVKYVQYMLDNSPYFLRRIEQTMEGDTSGRDNLVSNILNEVYNNNILQWLFGRGANSTIAIAGNFAHQDWTETLCNNGLIGVFILFNFFRSMFVTFLKNKFVIQGNLKYVFFMLFSIFFLKSIFSMSIQDLDPGISIVTGFLLATVLRHKN